jgi:hypothetical protein
MDRFLRSSQIRVRIIMKAVVIQGNLLLGFQNLDFAVGCIFAFYKRKGLPVNFLAGEVKDDEGRQENENGKREKNLLFFAEGKENQEGSRCSDNRSSLPVGENWNEKKIDYQSCYGRTQRLQKENAIKIPFLEMSIEDKKNSQREAYEKSKHKRIEQHRDYSRDFPREHSQEEAGKPEDDETEREKKYNSIICLGKS